MVPRVEPRGRGRSCVLRGPLVFSQSVEPRWVRINPKPELGSYSRGDWELYPLSNWNYAISLEDCGLETTGDLSVPFSSQLPPVTLSVQGREVTNWEAEDGCVKEYPEMPVFSGKAQEVRLVPYGCAKLRVTELPVLASGDRTRGR